MKTITIFLWCLVGLVLGTVVALGQNPTPIANLQRATTVYTTNIIPVVTNPGQTNGTKGIELDVAPGSATNKGERKVFGGFEVAQEDELLLLAVLDDRDAMLAAEFEELHAIWAAQMPGGFVESEPGAAFGDVLLGDPLKRFGCKGVGDALGDDAIEVFGAEGEDAAGHRVSERD